MPRAIRNRTGVVLTNSDEKVLLVPHYVDGNLVHWYLPGGGIDYLESIEAAALREFKEETGLTVELTENLGYIEYRRELDPWHSITFVFRARYLSGVIRAEASAYGDKTPRWFAKDELGKVLVPYVYDALSSLWLGQA